MAQAQGDSRTFPETGKTVKGKFLAYWNTNGGLPQQGYPITDEFQDRSETDGKTYTMQCFERSVFENHPENVGKPSEVLLSLLGNFYYKQKYQFGAPPGQRASTDNPRVFPETGKTLGGIFRQYWETHGGLAQQGFPISDEFQEKSDLDGKTYTVQYFERAVFEHHPEQRDPQFQILLSQLGTFYCNRNQQTPTPISTARANPSPTRVPTIAPSPTPNPSFDPNKVYRLTTQFRGDAMCLGTAASVLLQNCAAVSGQSWRIRPGPGGTWKLSPEFPGNFAKCLDTGNLGDCGAFGGQEWSIKPAAGQTGFYRMTNNFTGPNKCLDVLPNNLQTPMADCGNFSGQYWKFTVVP